MISVEFKQNSLDLMIFGKGQKTENGRNVVAKKKEEEGGGGGGGVGVEM